MLTVAPPKVRAFEGSRCIATGELLEVVLATKAALDDGAHESLFIFDEQSSALIEIDLQGTPTDVAARVLVAERVREASAAPVRQGPGRPKLGVVPREVTLLPRHWAWLNEQPGGASAAIRRLVEQARGTQGGADERRRAQDAAYRFMLTLAGDQPGYEEALRALYANDGPRFTSCIASWPDDVRQHAARLAERAFVVRAMEEGIDA